MQPLFCTTVKRLGGIAAGLMAALALALPAAAPASVVEVTASSGPAAEEYLEYRASKGEANRVTVNMKGRDVVIVDRGVKRIAIKRTSFGRCRATSARRVVCPGLSIFVILRDGKDTTSFTPGADAAPPEDGDPFDFDEEYEDDEGAVTEVAYVDGGPGDDRLKGTRYDDVIVPGPGADKVFARGGDDAIHADIDGADDHLRGGGGADAAYPSASGPVVVDLVTGLVTSGSDIDSVGGFERVHGGPGTDQLRGSGRSEALYGEGGSDTVDGRGGSDLLFGDSPATAEGKSSLNEVIGGEGDDFIDVRSRNPSPTSTVDCGAGADVFIGEVDDRVDPSCERVAIRIGEGTTSYEELPDFDPAIRAFPTARELDGDPVYEFACRGPSGMTGRCSGTFALESTAPEPVAYGSGSFSAGPGETVAVVVSLNDAGRAALLGRSAPVAVRVSGQDSVMPEGSDAPATRFKFGWQHVLAP